VRAQLRRESVAITVARRNPVIPDLPTEGAIRGVPRQGPAGDCEHFLSRTLERRPYLTAPNSARGSGARIRTVNLAVNSRVARLPPGPQRSLPVP